MRPSLTTSLVVVLGLLASCDFSGDDPEPSAAGAPATSGPNVIEYQYEFTVDCLAMSVSGVDPNTGLLGQSRAPTFGEMTLIEQDYNASLNLGGPVVGQPRCQYYFVGPLEAGPVVAQTVSDFSFTRKGSGTIKVTYNNQMWWPEHGEIVLEGEPSAARAYGRYEGIFINKFEERARIKGRFEWCEPTLAADCAHGIVGDELPYAFEVFLPGKAGKNAIPTWGWGTAAECRVLIDKATTGMQLDMQVAFWKGANITQLYTSYCDNVEPGFMNRNHLRFRAGGVTGPGDYGPFKVATYVKAGPGNQDLPLPQLRFETPYSFLFAGWGVSPVSFCALTFGGFYVGLAETTEDSECSWSIEEGQGDDPGEVRIKCTQVEHDFPGGIDYDNTDSFDFWGRCDIRYK